MLAGPKFYQQRRSVDGSEILLAEDFERIIYRIYRVIFFNWASPENVSRLAPPKFWNHIHFARHLDVFQS